MSIGRGSHSQQRAGRAFGEATRGGETEDKQGDRVLPTSASTRRGPSRLRPVRPRGVEEIAATASGRQRRRSALGSSVRSEGEDRNLRERLKVQKEQTRWWIQRQKEEREAAEEARRDAEEAYREVVVSRDKRAVTLARMEEECRRRLNEATATFNRALAEEQQHRRHCEAIQDEEDKKAEIYNHVTGDFLAEAKEQAVSSRGPHKPLTDRYKGMTADELKVFRDAQLKQIDEIRKIKLEEKRMNEDWDRLMTSHLQTAYSYERELNQRKSELNKKIAEENLRLAEQQKSHQEYLNRVVYKNEPTAAFYEQFNKGTR